MPLVPAVTLLGCTTKFRLVAAAGLTTTLAVWVMATALIVADTVLVSATVELSVPVATPLAFVVPTGWVSVLPVPVAARTTVAPGIGLPSASLAVTVIVLWLVPLEAVIGEVAATVDWAAATVPGLTTTLAVWVMATPPPVAEMVLVSATAELKVPVATPLAFVVPTGWVSVLPVPVAARTTVAPVIGLPSASFAVTVIVLWLVPLEAVIGVVALTVDCAAETAPGVMLKAVLV